jgi:hypothetical protein
MPQLVGLSLIPLLEGEAAPFEERTLFSGIDRYQIVSTIRQNWKFIFNPREIIPTTQVGTPYPVPRVGLYDLESDPHESRPITEHPMIRRFINAISRFRKWAAEWRAVDLPRADRVGETARKEAEENLRTLGYIH